MKRDQRIKAGSTYEFEQERVFSEGADATGKAEDEHHATHHQEQPHRVKTPEVCDGRDVGEDALQKEKNINKSLKGEETAANLCSLVQTLFSGSAAGKSIRTNGQGELWAAPQPDFLSKMGSPPRQKKNKKKTVNATGNSSQRPSVCRQSCIPPSSLVRIRG